MPEKLLNFYPMGYQLSKFPIRLPRSVIRLRTFTKITQTTAPSKVLIVSKKILIAEVVVSSYLSLLSILTSSASPSSPSAGITLNQAASAPGKARTLKSIVATSPGPALNSSAPAISGGNWISKAA